MRELIMTLLPPLALAGCSGSYAPVPLTPKQAGALDKELAGKVAGEKTACISQVPSSRMRIISNSVILYRISSKLVYRNDLIGQCNGLTRGDTLIVQTFGAQYCRGDIARTADLNVGIPTGSCALGDFTPYRAAAKLP